MTLATLLYPPPTKRGMDEWAYANVQHHRALNSAILRRRNISIGETQIWPIRQDSFQDFLRQHQQWHDALNGALGVAGVDLQNVDFTNDKERDAWIWLHFNSHRNYAEALGGGV